MSLKKKIQVTVDLTMLDWYKKQAEAYGVSVSGLINISMAEYRQQKESKESIGQVPQLMDMMKIVLESGKTLEDKIKNNFDQTEQLG